MKVEEKDDYQIKTNGPDSEFDPSVAFLQIPLNIKDKVAEYINSIADEADLEKLSSESAISPFQSQGCFFVISLEQIEKIHSFLKKALSPDADDIDSIRSEVQKALTALQG
jgi:hypothetical protein